MVVSKMSFPANFGTRREEVRNLNLRMNNRFFPCTHDMFVQIVLIKGLYFLGMLPDCHFQSTCLAIGGE